MTAKQLVRMGPSKRACIIRGRLNAARFAAQDAKAARNKKAARAKRAT